MTPDKGFMRHDARMLLRSALIGGAAALWSAWITAQTIHGVTETTPYTYLRGDRVVGSVTEVVERPCRPFGYGITRFGCIRGHVPTTWL